MKKKKLITRKVRDEHGYPVLYLGAKFVKFLGREVVLEKTGINPLAWEIRLKPSLKENVKRSGESKGQEKPGERKTDSRDQQS